MDGRVGGAALAEAAAERPLVEVPRDDIAIWKLWRQSSNDPDLYHVLLDPARFCLEHGLKGERDSMSAAAVKERQARRRDRAELAALEKTARAAR